MRRRWWMVALGVIAACSAEGSPIVEIDEAVVETTATSSTTTSTVATTTSTTAPPTTTTAPPSPPTEPTAPAEPPPVAEAPRSGPRTVADTGFGPMSVVGPLTLTHPAAHVERIGFHESTHDGAQDQEPLPSAASPAVLETRDRGTGARSAADVVVEPETEIRVPVTGTVIRGGRYTLYCDYVDEYVVIEPDARPGWEVKVLHVVGLQLSVGQHVLAGETPLALHAHQLPFSSQVDDLRTTDPAWPHVHVEVVDPSVPDRPTGPGCN